MKVIITGSTSFLGQWTIGELKRRRHDVYAFRHGAEEEKLPVFSDGNDTVLIHFGWAGAGSDGRQNEEIQAYNIRQSLETYRLAARIGCRRFIFAGSQAEYAGASAYGRAKKKFADDVSVLEQEYVKAGRYVPEFLHLRIFSVYGPGDHTASLISSVIQARRDGTDLTLGPCTQNWNYLYAEDFAKIISDLAERKETTVGEMDIGSADTRILKDFVTEAWMTAGEYFGTAVGEMKFGSRGNNAEGAAGLTPSIERTECLCPDRIRGAVCFAEGIRKTCAAFTKE